MIEHPANTISTLFSNEVKNRPFLIAGPCGAESKEQIMSSALFLKSQGVSLLRAGVWKARSRPNSFEGHGIEALGWLNEMRSEINMPFAVEVAKAEHVDEVLKQECDVIWIGARTSVNPFLIQEIADALNGVKIPVLIKNPVNPDLDLWQGAIERIYKSRNKQVAAIHRGFSSYENKTYRTNRIGKFQ